MAKQQPKNKRKPKDKSSASPGKPSKRKQIADEIKEEVREVDRDNDVTWYCHNPEMLRAAASLPFSQSLGSPVTVPASSITEGGTGSAVPGLMVMRYVGMPAAGQEGLSDKSSPINVAANGIYSIIRSHNSGGKNYDPPDLMIYLMAMDNAYAFYSWMVRIYGCMKTFSQRNRYLPELLVEAQGADYHDIQSRLAEFRYYINQFAARASSMCVPAVMSYYQRHFWLSQNVFADDQTLKAQLYMFVPACFFVYSPLFKPSLQSKTTNGLTAQFPIDAGTKYTLDQIIEFGNRLLNVIITDEDMNVMSGDILKAYGEGSLFRLSPIPEEYMVMPVYSSEVLSQIHNTFVFGAKSPEFTETNPDYANNKSSFNCLWQVLDATTATGFLRTSVQAYGTGNDPDNTLLNTPSGVMRLVSGGHVLNAHVDDVTPADVMIMTRLLPSIMLSKASNGKYTCIISASGSEWVANATIYKYTWVNGERQLSMTPFVSCGASLSPEAQVFQQHPLFYVSSNIAAVPNKIDAIIGDMDNYTVVDSNTLTRIHEVALLSQFGVPLLGQF